MANARPFIIALAFGLIAVVLVYIYIQRVSEPGPPTIEMARVVRSVQLIPKSTTISRGMIEEIEMNADAVTPEMVTELDEVLGQVSMTNIYEGSFLLHQMFMEETLIEQLSRQLLEGERAVTIGVTEVSGLAGNLNVGDRVDLMLTVLSHEEVGVSSTFTILRNVGVMAVGQDIGFDEDESEFGDGRLSKSVTLRLSPSQSEIVALASEVGSLRIALRHPDEAFSPVTDGTDLTDITEYTPTREDLEEAAMLARAAEEAEAQRRIDEARWFAEHYNTPMPVETGNGDESEFQPLPLLGPPPEYIELIIGGELQIIEIEPTR